MCRTITRSSRHPRHQTPEQSSARRVIYVTDNAGDARRGYLLPPYLLINGSSVTRTPLEAVPSEPPPFASSTSPIHGAPARKCPVLTKPHARKERRS